MKKALSITCVLFILLTASTVAVSMLIMDGKDKVSVTQQTIYGDESAARGITLNMQTVYNRQLFWNTSCAASSGSAPVTTQRLTNLPQDYMSSTESEPLLLGLDFGYDHKKDTHWDMNELYTQLKAEVTAGETVDKTVLLYKYCKYYPITVSLNIPASSVGWSGKRVYSDADNIDRVTAAVREYFKIPLYELETYKLEVSMNKLGNSTIIKGNRGGEHFELNSQSVISGDCIYFVFDAHTSGKHLVRTNEIKGGFGIYRLSYTKGYPSGDIDVDIDSLQTVFTLDPKANILKLRLSDDGRRLYLLTIEDGMYTVTTIDTTDYTQLQKLHLGIAVDETKSHSYVFGSNFLAVLINKNRLCVLSAKDDGTYELRFATYINQNGENITVLRQSSIYITPELFYGCDGDRLAVCRLEDNYTLGMLVYTANGLEYYGRYAPDHLGGTNDDRVGFVTDSPVEISFE